MYQLYIANKSYSSWSLRPWVLMRELKIPFEERFHARAYPIWNTQAVRPEMGGTWANVYMDQLTTDNGQFKLPRFPADLLVWFAPPPGCHFEVIDRVKDDPFSTPDPKAGNNPHIEVAPKQIRYLWDGTSLQTAHFLIQCVFCMFAEDARLLPEKLFETVLDKSNPDGAKAQARLTELFTAMRNGGDFALETIPYFNGGLFETIAVPPLTTEDVVQLLDCARMGWGEIEPAILGTLFERGLNPDMRSQLGAHYTDPATILKLIRQVMEQPLLAEWQAVKTRIAALLEKHDQGGKGSKGARDEAQTAFIQFIQRLKAYRVLDPACGDRVVATRPQYSRAMDVLSLADEVLPCRRTWLQPVPSPRRSPLHVPRRSRTT